MPQHRKPSDVLERSGAYDRNAKRRRKDPKGVGEMPTAPPAHLKLNAHQVRAWKQIVAVIPAGVATGSDQFVVECAVRILGGIRKSGKYVAAEIGQLRSLLGSLGLSPADRARLGTSDTEPKDDGYGEFGRGVAGAGGRSVSKTLKFPGPRKA